MKFLFLKKVSKFMRFPSLVVRVDYSQCPSGEFAQAQNYQGIHTSMDESFQLRPAPTSAGKLTYNYSRGGDLAGD